MAASAAARRCLAKPRFSGATSDASEVGVGSASVLTKSLCNLPRFCAATRPPGASRDPGSPLQALWVGGDRTWPPCPRSGRSPGAAPRTLAHRAPWAREKGVDQDGRTIRDWSHQRVQRRWGGLEWIQRFLKGAARDGTCPTGIESSSRRFDGGLQNGILAFRPPWYPTEPPRALRARPCHPHCSCSTLHTCSC